MAGQQPFLVEGLLVGGAILPAGEQNALPLVGERAHRGVMVELFHLTLMVMELPRPLALEYRLLGKFVKALA